MVKGVLKQRPQLRKHRDSSNSACMMLYFAGMDDKTVMFKINITPFKPQDLAGTSQATPSSQAKDQPPLKKRSAVKPSPFIALENVFYFYNTFLQKIETEYFCHMFYTLSALDSQFTSVTAKFRK